MRCCLTIVMLSLFHKVVGIDPVVEQDEVVNTAGIIFHHLTATNYMADFLDKHSIDIIIL